MAVSFGPLLFGIIIGSSGPTIDTMKNQVIDFEGNFLKLDPASDYVVFTEAQASWYTSMVNIGAMLGAILGGWIVRAVGFRKSFGITVPMYIVSWLTLTFGSNVWLLFGTRMTAGIAMGVTSVATPTYINEVSPTHLRGMLGTINQVSITVGILLVYFLGMELTISGGTKYSVLSESLGEAPAGSFCNWRAMAFVNLIPTLLLGLLLFFIPESPRWLASKGREEEALAALNLLRGGFAEPEEVTVMQDIVRECEISKTGPKDNQSSIWFEMWKARKQVLIVIAVQIFQQFSGINAIMFYCTSIMRNAKMKHPDGVSLSVMFEQVIVTLLACFLIDLCGRRALLLTSAAVMAVSCLVFGLYFFLDEIGASGTTVLVFISVYTYMAAFSMGVGAIPWLIMGEVLPNNVRSIASSIAITFNWMCAFAVTENLGLAEKYLKLYGVMWAFAACCIGLVVFTAVFIPETKGKTFEEIQEYFDGHPVAPSPGSSSDLEMRKGKANNDEEINTTVEAEPLLPK